MYRQKEIHNVYYGCGWIVWQVFGIRLNSKNAIRCSPNWSESMADCIVQCQHQRWLLSPQQCWRCMRIFTSVQNWNFGYFGEKYSKIWKRLHWLPSICSSCAKWDIQAFCISWEFVFKNLFSSSHFLENTKNQKNRWSSSFHHMLFMCKVRNSYLL